MNNREEKGSKIEPYIFIIDLDGTIIGDCSYQCDLYNIIELIKKNNIKDLNKYKTLCNNYLKDSYSNKSLLIRPHFITFINAMKNCILLAIFIFILLQRKNGQIKKLL